MNCLGGFRKPASQRIEREGTVLSCVKHLSTREGSFVKRIICQWNFGGPPEARFPL